MTTHKIYFCPSQHPHFINVIFVDSLAELENQWSILQDKHPADKIQKESFDNATGAFCAFNCEGGEDLGDMVFFDKPWPVVAHECSHAALSFLDHKVMNSSVVQAMPEGEQYEYYQEALATTVEVLFAQIEKIINGQIQHN